MTRVSRARIDFDRLSIHLIRAVRRCGGKSQEFVNRRFGKTYNQVHRWESGSTPMTWTDFVKLCRVCRLDLEGTLVDCLAYEPRTIAHLRLLRFLIPEGKESAIRTEIGVSRYRFNSWLTEKKSPGLAEMLHLFEVATFSTCEFCQKLTGEELPGTKKYLAKREKDLAACARFPFVGMVLQALTLSDYRRAKKHKPGFVAERVGISLAEEKRALQVLQASGHVVRSRSKYVVMFDQIHLTNAQHLLVSTDLYWYKRYMDKAADNESIGLVGGGHLQVSVSERAHAAILSRWRTFYTDVRKITMEDDHEPTRLGVVLCSYFDPSSQRKNEFV